MRGQVLGVRVPLWSAPWGRIPVGVELRTWRPPWPALRGRVSAGSRSESRRETVLRRRRRGVLEVPVRARAWAVARVVGPGPWTRREGEVACRSQCRRAREQGEGSHRTAVACATRPALWGRGPAGWSCRTWRPRWMSPTLAAHGSRRTALGTGSIVTVRGSRPDPNDAQAPEACSRPRWEQGRQGASTVSIPQPVGPGGDRAAGQRRGTGPAARQASCGTLGR